MSAKEETVQVNVPPGDQTGVYYMPICNLPFRVPFRPLKSWIRKEASCEVDRIEVFGDSTSGWIRFQGKDNFEKAWKLLSSGRYFDERLIIANDKNRTEPITIKKRLVQPESQQKEQKQEKGKGKEKEQQEEQQKLPPPVVAYSQPQGNRPAAQGQQAAASSTTSPQYSSTSGQCYAAGYNQAGGPSYSDQSMPTQGYPLPLQPTAMADSWEYYNYNAANAGPSSGVGYPPGYQYDGTQFALPYRDQQEAAAYYAGAGAGGVVPGQEPAHQTETEFVTTEARKLHVSPFPEKDTRKNVDRWITQRIYEKQTIMSIDIPMNSTKKYLRGHAFVVFDSAESAAKAMEQLNKTSYQGKKIVARTTTEGVAMNEQASIPTGPRKERHRGDKPQRPRHGEPDRTRSSSDKKSSSSAKKSSKTSSMKTLPDKDKKGSSSIKDAGPPLVVDGSCRRRDKR